MTAEQSEMVEYLALVIEPQSRTILAVEHDEKCLLPRVSIPRATRRAEGLQEALRTTWALHVAVLGFIDADSAPDCAVAELLVPAEGSELITVPVERLSGYELSEEQRIHLRSLLSGYGNGLFSRIGWIDEAIAWLEDVTQSSLGSKSDIWQLNVGNGFSLIRFHMKNGRDYWLKATGIPNAHEYEITKYLSGCSSEQTEENSYLPTLIALRPEWNAWLMSAGGRPISERHPHSGELSVVLEDAAISLARLQITTTGHDRELVKTGAFDQRLEVIVNRSSEIFEYLQEAMQLQKSTKVEPLERRRLLELRSALTEVCERTAALKIPNSILHGDLNAGNILRSDHCQFIDWSEAYVGFPLITLEHLLLLNKIEDSVRRGDVNRSLKLAYQQEWGAVCDPVVIEQGFQYTPMLGAVSALYGRGDWLGSPERNNPRRMSYARTLARHMDRAARALEEQEAVCH